MQNYFWLFPILLIPIILIQASGNAFGQNYEDLVRITADFIPDDNEFTENTYDMFRFSLSYTNGSRLCPSNSCIFQFQGTPWIATNDFDANAYVFIGVLRVGTPVSSGGVNYKVYDTRIDLEIFETTERSGTAFHKVRGPVYFGEIEYDIYDGTLTVGGGIVHLDINAQNPSSR